MATVLLLQARFDDVVGDVRGLGLFIGIEIVKSLKEKIPDAELSK